MLLDSHMIHLLEFRALSKGKKNDDRNDRINIQMFYLVSGLLFKACL